MIDLEDDDGLLCPHSAAGRPERFPAKACILAGECGCSADTSDAVALVRNAVLDEAIKIIEEYRIPVGNSAAGELACEWTRDALEEIRDMLRAMKENSND